mmetsp:Transcript_19147/g.45118  ORF Transcript_19147/g.45118 Transcript_19147/m.45118 type:complete len:355 (-) Transcript_19147:53-1117(-)|eukprot:CAMPEP_0171099410 /NCGR_PEP_ID=MMETSP0766_2-20121228/51437_1 /TAXON_ID=439317 /ORGANISM="Gambierdiscus australes, Strain CAWD 149" /LENGTH=354 /DNA_ID=CAMNT_0011559027 /DNA_START=119 /DNA_END=1183 /DNA_ORIENTATION=+
MPIKQEIVDRLTGEWQVGLFEVPCKAPVSFCYGCICSCCMTCQQRNEILDVIGEPYVCCGGIFPCGPLGEPQDRNCIYLEACCCPGMALAGNRFLIQTRFNRMNTACDDCLLWSVCLASWAICILQLVGCDVPEEIENLVDCAQMTVTGCMLGQQQVELDYIKRTGGYTGPSPQIMAAMTSYQQGLMQQAKPPQQQSMGLAGGAAVVGGVVAGAPGAVAMGGAFGAGKPQAVAPPPQAMGGGFAHGFMSTLAPNNQTWMNYCQTQQPSVDSQMVNGAWGECLAWSKVYEFQNPNYNQQPEYREDGPAGQVIEAMLNRCPAHMRQQIEQAANKLEEACESAHRSGKPLPIINYRA